MSSGLSAVVIELLRFDYPTSIAGLLLDFDYCTTMPA